MPPNQISLDQLFNPEDDNGSKIRVAILGCGMMGQEHISYISCYPDLRIDFICDPNEPSLNRSVKVLKEFAASAAMPMLLRDEDDLLSFASVIDLLVIASPNYLHTDSLLQWAGKDVSILVEKPVAISRAQHDQLQALQRTHPQSRIWVAMEYRYMPAIAKLLQLLPDIGELKMVTIRENRFPFLKKIGDWNRDIDKTGDTLVEKCCHFWDLFRLITGKEVEMDNLRSIVQRGLNYEDEEDRREIPILDSAYVILPFHSEDGNKNTKGKTIQTIGCLELCMYADGSRHQEEIIVTGTKGRLEAYLPENKVYKFKRPTQKEWTDRTIPPDPVKPTIYDCSVEDVHGLTIPSHGGYHYSSTSVEWYNLIQTHRRYIETGLWKPQVSLHDGLRAVEIGLEATRAIINE